MRKSFFDSEFGQIIIIKRIGARRLTLRADASRGVRMSIPFWEPYSRALEFLESRRDWVRDVLERTKAEDYDVEALRRQAKLYLPARTRALAEQHGFELRKIFIKNNRSNWGSCSQRGNINLNLHLMRVPGELRDYVILHELCHLKYLNHGPEFHSLLEELCPDHRVKSRELKKFRF